MTKLALIVTSIKAETPTISRFRLERADGGMLPGFEAGAHITIDVPGIGPRKYSLICPDVATAQDIAPRSYAIGVRLEPSGGGGSRFMHALTTGQVLSIAPPQNNFALKPGREPVALVAGGIGVTPLLTMAATLRAQDRPYRMAYAARSRGDLAFIHELTELAGDSLMVHLDDVAGALFDVDAYVSSLPVDTSIYMCGPKPMLKAGMAAMKRQARPREQLLFELFYSVAANAEPSVSGPAPTVSPFDDGSFEVVIRSSGRSFRIPPDKSILSVMLAEGLDPVHDCDRGECGVCQVGVLEGTPDHKDHILSDGERAANKVMQVCVSRSKSARLVLDL